jgi:hypothetical protein
MGNKGVLTLSVLAWVALAAVGTATVGLWGAKQDRVVGVGLDVLFQILGALESLAAEVALVRLQGDMDTDVRGDVVTLDRGGAAVAPLAGQVEVVCALATDMAFADVVLGGCQWVLCSGCGAGVGAVTCKAKPSICNVTWCKRRNDGYLRRAAQQRASARRRFATGRRAGRPTSLRRKRAWAHSAGWACPWAAAGGSWPRRARGVAAVRCSWRLAANLRSDYEGKTR